jgi:hypothetical protein
MQVYKYIGISFEFRKPIFYTLLITNVHAENARTKMYTRRLSIITSSISSEESLSDYEGVGALPSGGGLSGGGAYARGQGREEEIGAQIWQEEEIRTALK